MIKTKLQNVADDLNAYFAQRKSDAELLECYQGSEAECLHCHEVDRCYKLIHEEASDEKG